MSSDSLTNDFLSFDIDGELFGIDLSHVNQIIEAPELTKVPRSSELLEGIIHHNDSTLPIINFRKWLKTDNPISENKSSILIVDVKTMEGSIQVGLMVDTVSQVLTFKEDAIEQAPEIGKDARTEFIRGITRYGDQFIMLIDVDELFTDEELGSIKESNEAEAILNLESSVVTDDFINTYLTFTIGKEKLAVDANKVVEILDVSKVTGVPGSAEHLAGVVNIRGSILPVIDTRITFNVGDAASDSSNTIMVLDIQEGNEHTSVGAIVDAVNDIVEIQDEDINLSPSLELPFDPEFVKGVAKVGKEFVQLMNINKVFEIKELN